MKSSLDDAIAVYEGLLLLGQINQELDLNGYGMPQITHKAVDIHFQQMI